MNNCSISVRLIHSEKAPTVRGAASVTLADIGIIRDILIVETKRGLTAFGPSRPSANPQDTSRYYQIVDLAPALRDAVLERYRVVVEQATTATA